MEIFGICLKYCIEQCSKFEQTCSEILVTSFQTIVRRIVYGWRRRLRRSIVCTYLEGISPLIIDNLLPGSAWSSILLRKRLLLLLPHRRRVVPSRQVYTRVGQGLYGKTWIRSYLARSRFFRFHLGSLTTGQNLRGIGYAYVLRIAIEICMEIRMGKRAFLYFSYFIY